MAPALKLIYFALPGRGEVTRLMAAHAGLENFTEQIVTQEEWPELKAKMPFGQLPAMEVDGKLLAQTPAIERYVAKLAGLIPEDAWQAAKGDEVVSFMQEFFDLIVPTWKMPDEEKKAAREALVAGPLRTKLTKLADLLVAAGGPFFNGEHVTYADFVVHCMLSMLACGFIDHLPKDLISANYPSLKEFHARVAGLPGVQAFYKDVTEGMRLAYKELP